MQDPRNSTAYPDDALCDLINTQIGTANHLLRPLIPAEQIPDASVSTNDDLSGFSPFGAVPGWHDPKPGAVLPLSGFRAPGLYFTREGREARDQARQFLRRVPVPRQTGTQSLDASEKDREFLDIYDPYGKISMLKGGVGCIRLRPKMLDGGTAWFLSASSTGVAHEGFPVAIPDHLFQRYVDTVKGAGALRCTLRGKLLFLPDPVAQLYREYRGVPQLYLLVEEVIPDPDQNHGNLSCKRRG